MLNSLRLWNIILLINTQRDNADEHWAWAEATQRRFWFHNLPPNFILFACFLPGFEHFSGFAQITDTAVSMMHERPCYWQWQYYIVYFTRHFYDREHLSSGNKNVTDTQQGQQHYNIATSLLRDTALWKLWTTPRLHHFLHYRLKKEQKIIPSTIEPQRPPWEERLTW